MQKHVKYLCSATHCFDVSHSGHHARRGREKDQAYEKARRSARSGRRDRTQDKGQTTVPFMMFADSILDDDHRLGLGSLAGFRIAGAP
nr:hypothetical protein CFP56_09969 [Quercus suber]